MLKYPFLQDEVFEFLRTNDLDITDLKIKTYIYFTLYSQKQHGLSYDYSMFRQRRAYPSDLGYFRVLVCWAQIKLKAALFLQSKLPERLMKTRNVGSM